MTSLKRRIRVLIVDDSSMMRRLLKDLLETDRELEVVGSAVDPYDAREKLVALKPDVMTLDVEMPRMDGVTFLEKVMRHFPTRTVIISSLTQAGSDMAMRALSTGAIDVIAKPKLDLTKGLNEMADQLTARVKAAAEARLVGKSTASPAAIVHPDVKMETTHKVIAVASSTGGTEAIKVFLQGLPREAPGVLIVQHMPPLFTRSYAALLKSLTGFDVREAAEGDRVVPGTVLLAPGNFHMELSRSGAFYAVRLHQEPMLMGLRPSAEFLFRSVAKNAGGNAVGVVLTGLGNDGAAGLLEMKKAGSLTIAQNEETCVVYGMPKEAIAMGAAQRILPLDQIAGAIIEHWMPKAAKAA